MSDERLIEIRDLLQSILGALGEKERRLQIAENRVNVMVRLLAEATTGKLDAKQAMFAAFMMGYLTPTTKEAEESITKARELWGQAIESKVETESRSGGFEIKKR
jgi:hypothetical protein